jgi:P-type Ca2+ transporter type 2C
MVLVALTMAGLTIGMYAIYSSMYGHDYGRTIAFSALVVMQWANAFNARSEKQSIFKRLKTLNKTFYIGLALSALLQGLVIFGPLGSLLHITPIAIGDLFMTSIAAFITPILLVEIHKWLGRNYLNQDL